MKRLPFANWGLIVLTVIVSIAVPTEGSVKGGLSPLVLQRDHFKIYQLWTSLFQHAGWLHLIGNMLFLFIFGNAINAKLGHIGFLASYLGIGMFESLIWLWAGSAGAKLGASAAIMGICGLYLIYYPRNDVKLFWDDLAITLLTRSWTGELPGWVLILFYVAWDMYGLFLNQNSSIAYFSHLVGFACGVLIGTILVKGKWTHSDKGEQNLFEWASGVEPARRTRR